MRTTRYSLAGQGLMSILFAPLSFQLTENNAALAHDIENKLARCRAIEGETRESIEQLEKVRSRSV